MRKKYIGAAALLLSLSAGATMAFAASTPSVTVENGKNASVTYTYSPDQEEETKEDAAKLFGRFSGASSKAYTTQDLTITSTSRNNTPIEIYLKLEAEPVSDEYSVLNYYTFRIIDANGNPVGEDTLSEPDDTEKVIYFGAFNEQFTKDVKDFKVEYMIRDSMSHTPTSEDLSKLKVYIASAPIITDTVNDIAAAAVTPAPTPVSDASAGSAAVTAAPTETAAPDATPTPAPQTITKVCGTDITPGRYVVSGNGTVLIKSKDDEVKSETVVTDGKTDGITGVEQFVANLTDGDRIIMTALPGQEKPSVKFEKTNAAATTATAKPTASASKAKATTSPAAASAAKTNPKTGEGGVPVAALSAIMLAAAAAIGGLEIYKRRRSVK